MKARLYVWEHVLYDYGSGMIVCVAESDESAKKHMISEFLGRSRYEGWFKKGMMIEGSEPTIIEITIKNGEKIPRHWSVWGGG